MCMLSLLYLVKNNELDFGKMKDDFVYGILRHVGGLGKTVNL